MYAAPKTRPRLLAAGKWTRKNRAIHRLSVERLGEIRHRMAGAAMKAAIDGLLSVAFCYAAVARAIDRATGSEYAMTEAEWTAVLTAYARRAS